MFAKEEGQPVDAAALNATRARRRPGGGGPAGGRGHRRRQRRRGSKPSYATYVKDRLTGFGGTSQPLAVPRPGGLPGAGQARVRRSRPLAAADAGLQRSDRRARPARRPRSTPRTSRRRSRRVAVEDVFMSAASPGVISLFFRNDHYPSHEAYLFAIADAMRHEYEAIAARRLRAAGRLPGSRHGAAHPVRRPGIEEFRKTARLHVEALNHALARIPPEQVRMHLCWGNYEGPHHHDVPLARHHRHRLRGEAQRHLLRGGQSAPRARVARLRDGEAARGQGAHPRRARLHDELHRAPRAGRRSASAATRKLVGRENVIAGHRLRLRHLGRAGRRRAGRRVGQAGALAEGAQLASAQLW